MRNWGIPGLSLAIINENQVVYHTVKGFADVENNILVDNKTIFEGASLSKPIFAYFVMKFVEEGVLDLDKPLNEYLPYPDIAHDDRYLKITARMVLSHTTGFPNWRSDYPENDLFLDFESGTSYQYSGEGYQYLAKVLAHIFSTNDRGLETAFQDLIGKPLGLQYTKFIQDDYNLKHKAKPYRNSQRVDEKEFNVEFGAAYSIHSEAIDFSKWLITLINEEGLREDSCNELFKDQALLVDDQMDENDIHPSSWTLGFAKYEFTEGIFYAHGGNNFGYTSAFAINRENKSGVVIFTNADQANDFIQDIFFLLKIIDKLNLMNLPRTIEQNHNEPIRK